MKRVEQVVARELTLGDEPVVVVSLNLRSILPGLLTEAEKDIGLSIVLGRTTLEIATERETSVYTVNNQIAAIFRKLNVNSRAEFSSFVATKCAPCHNQKCDPCTHIPCMRSTS